MSYTDTFAISGAEVADEDVLLHLAEVGHWKYQVGSTGVAKVSAAGRLYQGTNVGVTRPYIDDHAPSGPYYTIDIILTAVTLAGNTGALFRASVADLSGYACYENNAGRLGLYRLNSAGTPTALGSLASPTWTAGQTHQVRIVQSDAGSGILLIQVYEVVSGTPTLLISYPEPAGSVLPFTGKVGVYMSGNAGANSATGIQVDSITVSDSTSLVATATTVPQNGSNIPITLNGVGTGWTPGTPGTPVFTIATNPAPGSNPPAIVAGSQVINSATNAQLAINVGNAAIGAVITITDPLNNLSVALTVVAALFAGTLTAGTPGQTTEVLQGAAPTGGTLPYNFVTSLTTVAPDATHPVDAPANAVPGATALLVNLSNLLPGTTYWSQQTVRDGQGATAKSNIVSFQTAAATALTAGAITPGAITQTTAHLVASAGSGGVGTLTPQWYRQPTPAPGTPATFTPSNATIVPGATSLTLDVSDLTPYPGSDTFRVRYTDALGNYIDSPALTIQAAAPGAATAIAVTWPRQGPGGYVGTTSAPLRISLGPTGGTVAGTVTAQLQANPSGAVFALLNGTPVTQVQLSNGTPYVDVTITAQAAGEITITLTNDVGLAVPAAFVFVVMAPSEVMVPVSALYGAQWSGQAAQIGYTIFDPYGNIYRARVLGRTFEDGATGVYGAWPVLPYDFAGKIHMDPPSGVNAPVGYVQVVVPSKPVTSILAPADVAATATAVHANLAPMIGQDGGVVLSAGQLVRLAHDGIDLLDPVLAADLNSDNKHTKLKLQLGLLIWQIAGAIDQLADGTVLNYPSTDATGDPYLSTEIHDDGTKTTFRPT